MKKKLLLLLCLLVTMGASGKVKSGTFSTGGTWRLDTETGELYIDAETVPDYHMWENTKKHHEWFLYLLMIVNCDDEETYYKTNAPWWEYRADIVSIRFSSKVKTIGTWAFAGLRYDKYKWDKENAKEGEYENESYWQGKYKGWYVDKSYGVEKVTFDGNTPVKILDGAFENNGLLDEFDFRLVQEIGDHAFEGTPVLNTHFPALEYMHPDAFDLWWFHKATEMYKRGIVLDKEMDYLMETCMVNFAKNVWEYENTYHSKDIGAMDLTVPYEIYLDDEVKFNGLATRLKGSHVNLVIGSDGWRWDSNTRLFRLYDSQDFDSPEDRPWHGLRKQITKVELHAAPGKNSFNDCTNLEVVQVAGIKSSKWAGGPDYVYPIGEKAFYGCTKLWSVGTQNISNRTTYEYPSTIGADAFNGCTKLSDFDYGLKHAKQIGARAFSGCDLGSIDMNVVESIGSKAFENGMRTYGSIYMNCRRPETASDAFSGVAETVTLFIPANLGDEYAVAPWNKFKLDKHVAEYPVKGSGWSLSSEGTLKVEQVNKGFEKPEDAPWYAYREYVRDIIVDAGIEIGDYAFCDMANVRSVSVPRVCTTIGKCAFKGCSSLVNIYLYKIQKIGDQAFEGCSALEAVELGSDITKMGDYVFRGCVNLNTIENMTKEPGIATENTFAAIGSTSYAAPQHRRKAARTAKDVLCTVPEQSLTKYLVANGWKGLAYACDGEHGNIAGSGRYYDGYWVIYEDGTLIASSDTKEGEVDFFSPREAVKRIEFKGNSDELGISTFSNFPNLEEVVLGERVKNIGSEYFKNCTKLKSINLENVDTIGVRSFMGCTALEKVNLKRADQIGTHAFDGCTSLTEVEITTADLMLGYGAFVGCSSLKSIDISGLHINSNNSGAFEGCTALETVVFDNWDVSTNMFKDCKSLQSIDLKDQCRYIYPGAFAGTGMRTIFCSRPTPPKALKGSFGDLDLSSITAYVPADVIRLYKNAAIWKDMNIQPDSSQCEPMLPVSGSLGDNGTWEIDRNYTLTIDGQGAMPYASPDNHNWFAIFDPWILFIENVVYSDGITSITHDITNTNADAGTYDLVKTVEIGADVEKIEYNAMRYTGLTDVYCFAPEPPAIATSDDGGTFDKASILANGTTLHVIDFEGTLGKYKNDSRWNWFPRIVADLPTRRPGTLMATQVVVDPKFKTLQVHKNELGSFTCQLTATVSPANATNLGVKWTSSDESVAKVDENGLVTVVGYPTEGEVEITATTVDGSNKWDAAVFYITDPDENYEEILATDFDANRKTFTVMRSQTTDLPQFSVQLTPANSTSRNFYVECDNDTLVNVGNTFDPQTFEMDWYNFNIVPTGRGTGTVNVKITLMDYDRGDFDDPMNIPEPPSVDITVNVIEDVIFTEPSLEGVPVTYRVLSLDRNICEVYGEMGDPFYIDPETGVEGIFYTGIPTDTKGCVTVPTTARGYNVIGTASEAYRGCRQLGLVEFAIGTEYIGDGLSDGCDELNTVVLPSTIKTLGSYCFANLWNLKDVHINATTPPAGPDLNDGNGPLPVADTYAFDGLENARLHVPEGCREAYNVAPWTEWFTTIQEDAVTAVDEVITSETSVPDVWYTLNGIRISKPTKPGLYINGGRKVVIK